MKYISTRNGSQGRPVPLAFEDVMLAGLARDGGLYLPAEWPHFSTAEIAALKGKPYNEVAFRVMRPFVGEAFDEATFRRLIAEAGADLVLHGHSHHRIVASIPGPAGPVPVIEAPSASAAPGGSRVPASFNLYRIEGAPGAFRCTMAEWGFDRADAPVRLLSERVLS